MKKQSFTTEIDELLDYYETNRQILQCLHSLPDNALLLEKEVSIIVRLSVSAIQHMRKSSGGIPFAKLGDGEKTPVRYLMGDVRTYLKKNTYNSTSAATAKLPIVMTQRLTPEFRSLIEIAFPFAQVGGKLVNYLSLIGTGYDGEIRWLDYGQYLDATDHESEDIELPPEGSGFSFFPKS
jgi:hypothetical protein